jgi:hypothetical protein
VDLLSATSSIAQRLNENQVEGFHNGMRGCPDCLGSSLRISDGSLAGFAERGTFRFVWASRRRSPTRAAEKSKATIIWPSLFPICRGSPLQACARQGPNAVVARCRVPFTGEARRGLWRRCLWRADKKPLILELARQRGNVSQACKMIAFSDFSLNTKIHSTFSERCN